MRPMLLEFPDDPAVAYLDRQYLLGPSLLVAPVFSADGEVEYYLPAGRWTNWFTNEVVEGGAWRQRGARLRHRAALGAGGRDRAADGRRRHARGVPRLTASFGARLRNMETDAPDDRVTLASVAEEAGVSLSTISKVLNGRADVSPPTRARVEQLLAERGYRRRGGGRSESRAELIELVFHELDPIWSMELIGGVEQVAKEHGLSVVLTVSGSRHAPDPDWIEGVMRRRPVGIILVFSELAPEYRERLQSRAIPFVIVDPAGDPSPDAPSVGSANWSGGLAATRHLIELGHTRIAAITGPEDMMCSLARVDGYRSAMNSAGLAIDPDWIRFGDFHVSGGRERARELLGRPDRPTAIFAGSDMQALGVMEAARERGIRVPEELSIVGYDDIPLARWLTPAPHDRAPAAAAHGRGGRAARRSGLSHERARRRRRAWTSRPASWCARAPRRPPRPDRLPRHSRSTGLR